MMTAQETALVKIRAEENADMIAADQTTLAAANRRWAEENADKIAADQTKYFVKTPNRRFLLFWFSLMLTIIMATVV